MISEDIPESIDSFDEYIESKFGISTVKMDSNLEDELNPGA